MHHTDYTNAARDLIAIRDRIDRSDAPELYNDIDDAAMQAMQQAERCADLAFEHIDPPLWVSHGARCVTWVEADDRFVQSSVGGSCWQAAPVTHIRVDWRDREDRHDDRKTFHLRVETREAFDSDFAAMVSALRDEP